MKAHIRPTNRTHAPHSSRAFFLSHGSTGSGLIFESGWRGGEIQSFKRLSACHCGKAGRVAACNAPDVPLVYSCGEVCGRRLDCGNHDCVAVCHEGDCTPCQMTPERVVTCPCGKHDLDEIYAGDVPKIFRGDLPRRESCLDAVPTCGSVCNRKLENCGHSCGQLCHEGPCPPCPLTSGPVTHLPEVPRFRHRFNFQLVSLTEVRCRCGFMDREIPCAEMNSRSDDARCEKRCSKKRSCGRHKCNEMCCIEVDHVCSLVCGRIMGCGLHRYRDRKSCLNSCPLQGQRCRSAGARTSATAATAARARTSRSTSCAAGAARRRCSRPCSAARSRPSAPTAARGATTAATTSCTTATARSAARRASR